MDKGLQSCLQIFPSATLLETKKFYESIGFRAICYLESSQPHICLYKDSIEIILTRSKLEKIHPNREVHGYGYDAYAISTNQEAFFKELKRKNIKIIKELNLTDYSNKEFIFEDNERRWIAIGCKENSKEITGLQLSHVAFYCDDIVEMERFYTRIFCLKRVKEFNKGQENDFFILGHDNFRIELFKKKNNSSEQDKKFKHFAIHVESIENTITMLKQNNIAIDKSVDRSTDNTIFKICFIRDPEGNVIEIMEGYSDD
jgi:catechol 2,3-dioxygenase-like lactoylglutathione lyase family enzyme